MNLVQLARSRRVLAEQRYSLEEYAQDVYNFAFAGQTYGLQQTYGGQSTGENTERADSSFAHWVGAGYKRNGVVFACELARLMLFSEARFQFQPLRDGRPGDLHGTPALRVLENPWPNGSTGELLARMIQDVDLAGNAYVRRTGPLAAPRLERLRPDWVSIVLGSSPDLLVPDVLGYIYEPGGPGQGDPVPLLRSEVAHWSPIPDPVSSYRGMSWLTPVLRDILSDGASIEYKNQFFNNAATPNMIVKFDANVLADAVARFKALFNEEHAGARNAYKTLFLGGGADATVVGHDFKQMDFKAVQGHGETRVAAAAGVPPIIVGLSEGLEAATYSNYAQARRRFVDLTMRPLWRSACAALATIVDVPPGERLWYDDRDIPALREDEGDAANIQAVRASTITQLIREGFTAESAIKAIDNDDFRLLEHTGALSIQLQAPGAGQDDTQNARGLVEMVQKLYLGVGVVLTAEEARDLLNRAGAGLGPTPPELAAVAREVDA